MTSRLERLGIIYFLPAILIVTIVMFGIIRMDQEERGRYLAGQRLSAAEQLSKVAASLESNIHGNVNLVYGLAAAVAANPTMNRPQFAALSERLFDVPSQLRNVVAAPDLVVRYVYPEHGNETIVGFDYLSNPQQAPSVRQAIQRRSLVITGPIDLVQGGRGLLVRCPIFSLANGSFWGIVSGVIDIEKLYADSNLGTDQQVLEIAMSQRPVPDDKDVYTGDKRVFQQDAVRTRIELGYDTWYLAAVPKGGWKTEPPQIATFRLYAAIVAIGLFVPLLWAGLLMKQRQRNISTLRQREEELETLHHRLSLALDASRIGVWEYEPSSDTLTWDRRLLELYDAQAGKNSFNFADWKRAVHPDDIGDAQALLIASIEREVPYITQFRLVAADGTIRHVRAHGATYRTSTGIQRIVGANWDVTEDVDRQNELRDARMQAEEQNDRLRDARRTLEHQSLHDALTGLPNRRFLDQFMEAIAAPSAQHRLAFIHFDLDRFKEVNDTLGHAAGDEVLRQSTARLQALIGEDEFAARIGGDEFVVVTSGPTPETRAKHLARAIVKALGEPLTIDGSHCHIGCSAGVAVQTDDGEAPRQLLINADVALYEAKKRGRGRMELFCSDLLLTAITTKRLSDELIAAIDNHEIVPFFQPQFDAQTRRIVGVEALARWQHPERGLMAPAQFLDIADNLHRAADIDALILEKSLQERARWLARGIVVPHLSVNISAQRLADERLLADVASLSFTPGTLSFELLESISFDSYDTRLRTVIGQLRELGIDIEVDDFGSGHASIISLLELAPKRLKIDRRLIAPLEASGSQRRLVASIIEIGQSQGIGIVAEGVETLAHADILRAMGCQTLQGYAFARPMSSDDFIDFAERWQNGLVETPRNLKAG